MSASTPLVALRLDDRGGSLRSSLPRLVGRAFERVFHGPDVRFKWSEVRLVQRAERFMVFRGVFFEVLQQGKPKTFILHASERTISEILDYAQARGARVSRLTRRTRRFL